MCVCDQVGDSLRICEHLPKYCPMLLGRPNDSGTRLIQPALHSRKGLVERERVFEDSWIGPHPNEGGQNRPA